MGKETSSLEKNATAFLQKRYPAATVLHRNASLINSRTKEVVSKFWLLIAHDPTSGIKQRALAINSISCESDLACLTEGAKEIQAIFEQMDQSIFIGFDNILKRSSSPINTAQMPFSPKAILYTKHIAIPHEIIMDSFASQNLLVEVIDESALYRSVFLSYGGTDNEIASTINQHLKNKGIKTWFFQDDAPPGQKLHRVMHAGVNNHDRVLLICSKQSLSRKGVLNEIERALEREAAEGGADILIPITLDDYVYGNWAPERPDLASQVRSRVITKVNFQNNNNDQIQRQLDKLAKALLKTS